MTELVENLAIGNPIAILVAQARDILLKEMNELSKKLSVETLKNFVKVSKERVKKELDRDILIDLPFDNFDQLITLATIEGTDEFISWFSQSDIRLLPEDEDEGIEELFNTFPIRR